MITNNPNMKRGNIARTFLIILGVVIALYLSLFSGVLSTSFTESLPSLFSKSLALQDITLHRSSEGGLLPGSLWATGEKLLSVLDFGN